jgi:hypothetical protein
MADLLTDINDAYAVQINPVGANQLGPANGLIPPPPAVQNFDPVVILSPMSSTPTTTPIYPESMMVDATRAQQAAANHGVYAPRPAPYIESTKLDSPAIEEPGYIERLGLRSRDVVRLIVLAFMIALGISIHWVGSHYITEWLESSDFNARQRLAVRLSYPIMIVVVMWNIKAFQQ